MKFHYDSQTISIDSQWLFSHDFNQWISTGNQWKVLKFSVIAVIYNEHFSHWPISYKFNKIFTQYIKYFRNLTFLTWSCLSLSLLMTFSLIFSTSAKTTAIDDENVLLFYWFLLATGTAHAPRERGACALKILKTRSRFRFPRKQKMKEKIL